MDQYPAIEERVLSEKELGELCVELMKLARTVNTAVAGINTDDVKLIAKAVGHNDGYAEGHDAAREELGQNK